VPTVIVLRKLVPPRLYPLLYALLFFYLMDLAEMVAAPLETVSRLIFLAKCVTAILFLVWMGAQTMPALARLALRVARMAFVLGLVADSMGYLNLAALLADAVLESAYMGVILYGVVRILEGLTVFALRLRPLRSLGVVDRHRALLARRSFKILAGAAFLLWLAAALELLSLLTPLINYLTLSLSATIAIGGLRFTLGDVAGFVLVVWASFLVSAFVRFILEEDVYPRVSLARGIPYALSTMLHYSILLLGFLGAMSALNIDMGRFTVMAGAFGVGLGFGLQTIVNNFVSGLILLFERPVSVGDVVQLGDHQGLLSRIGLRASVLRTSSGAEVIVPNASFMAEKVVNWTLSDPARRLEMDVSTNAGSPPDDVISLLLKAIADNKDILAEPAPQALLTNLGDKSMTFQVRAWTHNYENVAVIKSDLLRRVLPDLDASGFVGAPAPKPE
jgi:potassium efflux system protein